MPSTPRDEVTIPELDVSFQQLLHVIRNLDAHSRTRVAQVLADTEMDVRLAQLVDSLARRIPAQPLTDREIQAEIDQVRREP